MTMIRASFAAAAEVDTVRRRIVGLVVPWGEAGHATVGGSPAWLTFERGSLIFDNPNAVKLVVDHLGDRPVFAGKARDLVDTDAGLVGTFSVSRTTAGDDLLVEASDELRTGLSIEAELPLDAPDADGVYRVTAAAPGRLYRVAVVETPAFDSARVTEIAASKGQTMPETNVTAAEVPDSQLAEVAATLSDISTSLAALLPAPAADSTPAGASAAASLSPVVTTASTAVTREPFPYGRHGMQGSEFFRDLLASKDSPDAGQRVRTAHAMWQELAAKRAEAADEPIAKSNIFIPNTYDLGLYVGQLRFPRVLVDAVPSTPVDNPRPFPIPRFVSVTADGGSGEVVAAHSEGVNPASGEMSITPTTATPAPYSGKLDINREAVDGGAPGMDGILFTALEESYNQVTEAAAWTALLGTSGATAPTSVPTNADLEVEARAFYKQVRGEMAAFGARRGIAPDAVLFGPGVYQSAASADSTASSGQPLYPYFTPTNVSASITAAGAALNVLNVPGVQAPKCSTDKAVQLRYADCHAWESPGVLQFRWEEVAGPAKVRFIAFGYFVFACLQPKGLTIHTQL